MNINKLLPQSFKNRIHYYQAVLSNYYYDSPSSKLKIIGVTGTDGKTTTCSFIYHILKEAGFKVGLITSVSAKYGKKEEDTGFHVTTPDPWEIPKLLKKMIDNGVEWVILEVTSHALDQNRLGDIKFEKAVFTNITKEHLDYHKSWREYANAKIKLIDKLIEGGELIYKNDEMGAIAITKKIRKSNKVFLISTVSDKD